MKPSNLVGLIFLLFSTLCFANQVKISQISTLSISSAITPATFDYLKHQFGKTTPGTLAVIKLNTPGGLISTTKDIITLIGEQKFPIAVWIGPEGASASSAGAIIASAAHFVLMSPGTNIGAATPVGLGEDLKESDGKNKALNDLSALVRSLSNLRGRPSAPFEDMIRKASSFTDKEAMNLKIIDGIVKNENQIKDVLNNRPYSLQGVPQTMTFADSYLSTELAPTMGQKLFEVLADPSTAYILFLLGVALIYFEFQAPGGFIAGTVGVGFLILAGMAFQVLPLNWGSFSLILLGVVFFVLEIYVTSYGLLALGGTVSLVFGSLFLFHDEAGFITVEYSVIFSTLAGILAAGGLVGWYLVKEKKYHGDFFTLAGNEGVMSSTTQVKVAGETWKVQSTDTLQPGDKVEVISVNKEKLILEVKRR
jgi:membrane-bound serine protease (ClpP class)